MTETDWLIGTDPRILARWAWIRLSQRKQLLIGVHCACQMVHDFSPDSQQRWARHIALVNQLIDGVVTFAKLPPPTHDCRTFDSEQAETQATIDNFVGDFLFENILGAPDINWTGQWHAVNFAGEQTKRFQCTVIRHITGNPFRPYPAPDSWPANVIGLAQTLYDGDDNRRILADALEEAGHADLARHFREEPWHPKGCWAVDLILGKH